MSTKGGRKTIQPFLPGFGTNTSNGDQKRRKTANRWYYICDTVAQKMLQCDDGGNWVWVEHDTIRDTPHLFNGRNIAEQERRRQAKKHKGKLYPVLEMYRWKV